MFTQLFQTDLLDGQKIIKNQFILTCIVIITSQLKLKFTK